MLISSHMKAFTCIRKTYDVGSGRPKCGTGDAHPPWVQILSISCSFWENLAKSYADIPPRELAPPNRGNPWSATGKYHNGSWKFWQKLDINDIKQTLFAMNVAILNKWLYNTVRALLLLLPLCPIVLFNCAATHHCGNNLNQYWVLVNQSMQALLKSI